MNLKMEMNVDTKKSDAICPRYGSACPSGTRCCRGWRHGGDS